MRRQKIHMSKKECSKKQENTIAEFLGWDVVSGSGSRPNMPGDVTGESWLGECKTHVEPGHRIVFNFSTWNKIEDEASSRFKFAAYFVDDGSQTISKTWVMFTSAFLDNCKIANYPYPLRKTLSFSSDTMFADMESRKSSEDDLIVYQILNPKKILYLTNLQTFEKLI